MSTTSLSSDPVPGPDENARFGDASARSGPGARVDELVRVLLSLRGVAEGAPRIAELAARLAGARWAALYLREDGVFHPAGVHPAFLAATPIPAAIVGSALRDGEGFVPLPGSAQLRVYAPGDARLALSLWGAAGSSAVLLLGPPAGAGRLEEDALRDLAAIAGWIGGALDTAREFDGLRSLVFVDPLTGCYNRRGLEEHLQIEWVRASRYRRRFALMVLDVDKFKQINDAFGHQAGDDALVQLGSTLRSSFRATDRVCRFGGDEFAVLFPETRKEEVAHLAERLRRQVAGIAQTGRVPVDLTISIGVAAYPQDADDPDDLFAEADRAMYRSKTAGGNQVTVAGR